nr:MAG TPA: hypothetical protein [Caudoviricetes sp.]
MRHLDSLNLWKPFRTKRAIYVYGELRGAGFCRDALGVR